MSYRRAAVRGRGDKTNQKSLVDNYTASQSREEPITIAFTACRPRGDGPISGDVRKESAAFPDSQLPRPLRSTIQPTISGRQCRR